MGISSHTSFTHTGSQHSKRRIAQRSGKRQFCAYREEHHSKLAAGLDAAEGAHEAAPTTVATSIRQTSETGGVGEQQAISQISEVKDALASFETETQYTMTSFAATVSESATLNANASQLYPGVARELKMS